MVGLALAPEARWLALCEPLFAAVDYFSVTPETLWTGPDMAPNGYWRAFAALREHTGAPFVAHSVSYSLGSLEDDTRRRRWREAMKRDHATFAFLRWTDHLGMTTLNGRNIALPISTPFTAEAAATVRGRLSEMGEVVGQSGFENTCHYFLPGRPLEEPAWMAEALGDGCLLLDLHNLYTMALNLHFDPMEWLARAPLERVAEIHLSGGSVAPADWGVGTLRLDSHDAAVPEGVWALLEAVLPRCPSLQGVTLERIEGSVGPGDVAVLREEIGRIRRVLG